MIDSNKDDIIKQLLDNKLREIIERYELSLNHILWLCLTNGETTLQTNYGSKRKQIKGLINFDVKS